MSHRSWLKDLRATRAYTDQPVPDSDLSEILEAARWTGSSLNSQPWMFVVVTDSETKQTLSATGRFAAHLAGAPLVIVLVGDPGRGEFDLGRVAQNMMLTASELGLGSCPATLHDQEAVAALLGIPDDRPARHAIAFGHPDPGVEQTVRSVMRSVTKSSRKPIAELVRWERW